MRQGKTKHIKVEKFYLTENAYSNYKILLYKSWLGKHWGCAI